jgi:hypothetical protein
MSYPQTALPTEPGFTAKASTPIMLAIIGQPDSVCHQWSIAGTGMYKIFSWKIATSIDFVKKYQFIPAPTKKGSFAHIEQLHDFVAVIKSFVYIGGVGAGKSPFYFVEFCCQILALVISFKLK